MNNIEQTETNILKKFFHDWTKFELTWLIVSTITMIGLSIVWQDSLIALISGITGIIGVVLCAKGKLVNYAFAIVNVALYAYICYNSRLYGEAMLNAFYFFPMCFVGFFMWKKNQGEDGEVVVRNLTKDGMIRLGFSTVIAILVYYQVLVYLGGHLAIIDATTTIVSVIALFLQVNRYSEQWLLWIIVNIISIIMWVLLLLENDPSAITMIVMWSAYLINAVYGYNNWRKMA
ncbi:MAG: nicotinamide mononucleotide transporter PnuC [Epulopiscium sp. Nele67-Bin004]|nr:MAG: nicotinamide mononucleotide transporter PnuC [Epulopiscium sp. Nele67-Bin004]